VDNAYKKCDKAKQKYQNSWLVSTSSDVVKF
jgi:hypothetical protein